VPDAPRRPAPFYLDGVSHPFNECLLKAFIDFGISANSHTASTAKPSNFIP